MTDYKSLWEAKNIKVPHKNDILLGRGGSSIHNHANVRYRTMVREHKKAYQMYTRRQKTQLAEELVRDWQTQNPPGRFLEKDEKHSTWYCISEKSARKKTSQLLREGAPKIRRQLKTESNERKASLSPVRDVATTTWTRTMASSSNLKSKQAIRAAKAKAKSAPATGTITPVPSITPTAGAAMTPNRPLLPRMATPNHQQQQQQQQPVMFTTPPPPPNRENWPVLPGPPPQHQQRWQPPQWPSPYYGTPYHYYASPTTTVATPTAATNTAATQTPLRSITPADTNQMERPNGNSNTNNQFTTPKRVAPKTKTTMPTTTKPAMVEPNSSANGIIKTPARLHIGDRQFSVTSPESVLEFELNLMNHLPISSWDDSNNENENTSGDVVSLSSLVDEQDMMEPAVQDLTLPQLSSPSVLSPPRLELRKDSHPSYLDGAVQSFSFDSHHSMERQVIESENLDTSTIDILNELDKELEQELFLRPCHSL